MPASRIAALLVAAVIVTVTCGCGSERESRPEQESSLEEESALKKEFPVNKEKDAIQPERAVVRVKAGNSIGSAVLEGIGEDKKTIMLLTAGHVLDYLVAGDMPVVILEDGTEHSCDSYVRSESIDVAALFIENEKLAEQLEQEGCFAVEDKARFDSLKDGDICIAIGAADGGEKSVCTGEILDSWIFMEDYSQYMIWAEVEMHPGMSGGGLFDGEGYFLGILSGGSEDGQAAIVPFSLILSEFHN